MNSEYVVEMKGICKRFGGIHALKDVDLGLRRCEIMGIVGDNGAGKSTLMKILSGAYQADEGEILIDGELVHIRNPHEAFQLGISMIYQDLALFNKEYLRRQGAGSRPTRNLPEQEIHVSESRRFNP
jgi:ABC-type sugar transport system ATPase subunit